MNVKPQRVISPRLRIVLVIVLALFSLLLANGIYLSSITFLQFWYRQVYENYFYQLMFIAHLILGLIFTLPVIVFGFYHWRASRNRRNKRAIRIGYALLAIAIVVLVSGFLLTRIGSVDLLRGDASRSVVYWMHIITPLAAIWLYWLHRLVGPKIKWYVGRRIAIATAVCVGSMILFQIQDPRDWDAKVPKSGDQYFQPSLARTRTGKFIPAASLQNDDYCKKCHADIYNDWFHSAHHNSSFNNPAYLYAVRETRESVTKRDGSLQASRWCAGCHDPVPFFSGAFDDPNYDDVNDPTSQAGITCTVCHAISNVRSNRGNADYVIEEPMHYPFAYSKNPWLQKVNELLVKAKPSFHKAEMLKPVHTSAEFCSTCHKVNLPKQVTGYKEFLRGQNHYDSYLLSGVSGHGSRSFYYPEKAQTNCNGCHMEFKPSNDFGAKIVDGKSVVHNHFFPGGNTALPYWRGDEKTIVAEQKILEGSVRVDIFGIRKQGLVSGELTAPIRPEIPTLQAGETYLLETIIRTLKLGHHLTQGTVDSNQLWLELTVRSDDKILYQSGSIDENGTVDPWSHFVSNFIVDKNGDRISRRNAQDIFTALYNNQIPPGAGQTVHYKLAVPDNIKAPLVITAALKYRKFDQGYIDFMNNDFKPGDREFVNGGPDGNRKNELPITTMAEDVVVIPVRNSDGELFDQSSITSAEPPILWQRWNDYGIGLFLSGNAQLRQAATAFEQTEVLGRSEGAMNLARVWLAEGNLNAATDALQRAERMKEPPPPWTFAWLSGEVARQQGQFELAEKLFRSVLYDQSSQRRERKFDFSQDYVVRNQLGSTLIDLADKALLRGQKDRAKEYITEALSEFLKVLEVDSENNTAYANLRDVYLRLADLEKDSAKAAKLLEKAQQVGEKNAIYKPDENAAEVAIPKARAKYPAADHAAEKVVIYDLSRNQDLLNDKE